MRMLHATACRGRVYKYIYHIRYTQYVLAQCVREFRVDTYMATCYTYIVRSIVYWNSVHCVSVCYVRARSRQ